MRAEDLADVETFLAAAVADRLPAEVDAVRHELLRDPTPFRRLVVALLDVATELPGRLGAGPRGPRRPGATAHPARVRRSREPSRPSSSLFEDARETLASFAGLAEPGETVVRIGRENDDASLSAVSIVATAYDSDSGSGVVCLIGPTRMEYVRAIGMTSCVADGLSETL